MTQLKRCPCRQPIDSIHKTRKETAGSDSCRLDGEGQHLRENVGRALQRMKGRWQTPEPG
ncbi:hypothetical protein C6W88_01230 [Halomonas litopenaei]|uniref:CsbD family protein n=1 Tax=Halomonas litopenaei TaxID=2109328 RepID=A0ABX5J321_9GAMM|nr:hypothetical protein C6W89_03925 [Halomonas sp. SYSU XM8]PTL96059.1 hypothetical protein C6W88_01230 [Halomonas litopenaei]